MTHIVLGHKVPGETKRASLQQLFPPWTVTREQYAESLSPKRSGISNDVLLFSEVGLTLVHHYRVHSAGQPHAMFQGKYLAQLRLLLLTGTTTPERPLGNASPQVTHMSGITDDSRARLRPPSERPLGNASPQVTHVSGKTDDSCAKLRPPSERPLGNAKMDTEYDDTRRSAHGAEPTDGGRSRGIGLSSEQSVVQSHWRSRLSRPPNVSRNSEGRCGWITLIRSWKRFRCWTPEWIARTNCHHRMVHRWLSAP